MKKLFLIDVLVKIVVLVFAAAIWFGPAGAAAQAAGAIPAETASTIHPVARTAIMTGGALLVSAVFAALFSLLQQRPAN